MRIAEQLMRASVGETRDPRAATTPVVYQSPGHPMIPQWDAQNAINWGYYANVFVYRCVQVRAEALSSVPFRVGADPGKPNDYDPKNPLALLLGPPPYGPNPVTSARQLWAWSLAQKLIAGRFGWELEPGARDVPIAFWPLPAPYLKPIPSEGGGNYFRSFEFGKYGEEKTLAADRVFYHWRPRADDWRQPETVLQSARLDVSVAVMQDRYDYAFLRNDARPAAVIIHEAFEVPAEGEAFKRQFAGDFGGPDNAGKPIFVEADGTSGPITAALDIKTLGLSQKDSQAVERYKNKIQAICVAFGTPLSKLGDASARTFSNAGQEATNWWQDTILPDLIDLQDAVNIQLAPRFGDNVGWFDLTGIEALQKPQPYNATEAVAAYKAGVINGDELRAVFKLPAAGLTEYFTFQPPAPVPVSKEPALPAPKVLPALPAAASAPKATRVTVLPPTTKVDYRAVTVITSTTHVNALEATWTRSLRRLFARQADAVLSRLEGKLGRQALRDVRATEPDKIFNRAHWEKATAEDVHALYESTFVAGGGRVATQFGITFDLEATYVQEFIKARANKLAGQVTDTTYDQITTALAEGVGEGETIPQLATRIRAVFDQADLNRSVTIARTEVISAYNAAGATVAGQLPSSVVGGQEWITTEDARTRPAHAGADGQVVPMGQSFQVGGDLLAYPGDPNGAPGNVINCRCTIAFLTPDEMDARAGYVEIRAAYAVWSVLPGTQIDEVALRRALREARAA